MQSHLDLRMPGRPFRFKLKEDRVHDPRRQDNFAIRDGHGRILINRAVEGLDQKLHAGLHVEIPGQESPHVLGQVTEILLCNRYRWDELLEEAFEPRAAKLD
jgi:hypothetical protein